MVIFRIPFFGFWFRLIFFALLIPMVWGCHSSQPPSFYYWKTIYKISGNEKVYLHNLKVQKLYLRFFDVDQDENLQQPIPRARIQFQERPPASGEIIPVIYIMNKVLLEKDLNISVLSDHILQLTGSIAQKQQINFKELQLDCDWTDKTQQAYFALLEKVRKILHQQGKILSVTIRLHQVKYREITGVPPVDRGMLMYYNMGRINGSILENSILDQDIASRYTSSLSTYPLKLDVAFPLFSWGIHIRKGKVIELLNQQDLSGFNNHPCFKPQTDNIFRSDSSFFYRGFYFMKDDLVKIEQVTPKMLLLAAKELKEHYNKFENIAFYHLDSLSLSHYDTKTLRKVSDYYH